MRNPYPDAAAPTEAVADIKRGSIAVGTTLLAPEDKQSVKARANWMLHQIKGEAGERVFVRLLWPGNSDDTHSFHCLI